MIVHLPKKVSEVLVSDPETVDAVIRTDKITFLIGKNLGQTNVFFFDSKDRQIANLEIQVERDLLELRKAIREILPDQTIRIKSVNKSVILTGEVANVSKSKLAVDIATRFVGEAANVVNTLTISEKQQVTLKVTVVEMQRNVLKQLGVDLSATFNLSSTVLNFATVNPFTLGTLPGGSGNRFTGSSSPGGDFVDGTLRAMERNGMIRTLAEPTLTAVSGEAARFLAGGEFPVPVDGGNGSITVQYKPFGVGLAFTPVVLSHGRISLKVSTEVSELSSQNAITLSARSSSALTVPSLSTRRAETVVEMPSGGSLVMAGLIRDELRQDLNGVPTIKDVPILGALFRSRDYKRNESELVVIITPYIVKAVSRQKLSRPDEGFNVPHDVGTSLLGRLNKVYGIKGQSLPEGPYHGDFGFIED